jgi:hypothetical protein
VKQQDENRSALRDRAGKFRPGESGNRAGRPAGSRNKVTSAYLELLDAAAGDVLAKVIELARSGDRFALRLCLDRILPARRDRVVDVPMPVVEKAVDISQAMAFVIASVADGSVSMEEGRQFSLLLEVQRRALETSELAVRLQVLEQAQADSPSGDGDGYGDKRR